jgi:hypothetical protein
MHGASPGAAISFVLLNGAERRGTAAGPAAPGHVCARTWRTPSRCGKAAGTAALI